jgi:polysaccharide biosynthesis protein PslH
MKLLWLTLADPLPANNGQFIYSAGLIEAVAACGAAVHVVGFARDTPTKTLSRMGLHWNLVPTLAPPAKWKGYLEGYPQLAARSNIPAMRRKIFELLQQTNWAAVVFDSISVGWALYDVLRHSKNRFGNRLPIVYIAHNCEHCLARDLASRETRLLRKLVKRLDAYWSYRLERDLVKSACLVTANSPTDCEILQSIDPTKKMVSFLPPGYGGQKIAARKISPHHPRSVVIVGSFNWKAKRQDMENFLAIACPVFAKAGIELQIVGDADPQYLNSIRSRFPHAVIVGSVPDITPFLTAARIGLVIDRFGGFKLKTLDYVFNRVPIFAIDGSAPGLPLEPGKGIIYFPDHAALVEGIVRYADDLDSLNKIQNAAFDCCRDKFDWQALGRSLALAIQTSSSIGA